MKYWGVMYHLRNGSYVEGVGDRSVVRLDGRLNSENMKASANDWAVRHRYDGFTVCRGDNLLDLFQLTRSVVKANPANVWPL